MRHRDNPKFSVIAKNDHLGFCASSGEAVRIGVVGEFVNLAHDFRFLVRLFGELLDKLGKFSVRGAEVFDFIFSNQPRYIGESVHFYGETLKNREGGPHVRHLFAVLIRVAECLFFVHVYTLALNCLKAKPSTRRGFTKRLYEQVF